MHIVCKDEYGNHLTQLTQWDQNITICIYGLGLSEKPEINFANRDSETAYRLFDDNVTLNVEEDIVSTFIPNDLLWENKQIYVYVTSNKILINETNTLPRLQVIYSTQIPVKKRTKPADFYLESNVQGVDVVSLKLLTDSMYFDLTTIKDETIPELRKGIADAETDANKYTDGKISELSKSVSETYATQSAFNILDEKVGKNTNNLNTQSTLINTTVDRVSKLETTTSEQTTKLNTLIGSDNDKSVRTITLEEVAKILNDNDETDIDTLEEIAAWIKAHPDSVAALNKSISDNADAIKALQSKDTELSTAITTAESNANSYTDTKINELQDESTGILAKSKAYSNETFVNNETFATTMSDYSTTEENNSLYAVKSLEHIHENQTVLNNITAEKMNLWDTMSGDTAGLFKSIFNAIYPVGCIYMSTTDIDPSILFGGTWVTWGSGRVPVGVDVNDEDFATVEKEIGDKVHELSLDQLPVHTHDIDHSHTIPGHSHTVNEHSHAITGLTGKAASAGAHTHTLGRNQDALADGSKWNRPVSADSEESDSTEFFKTTENGAHTHTVTINNSNTGRTSGSTDTIDPSEVNVSGSTGASGKGIAHNNLQPSITCYMWKRLTLAV